MAVISLHGATICLCCLIPFPRVHGEGSGSTNAGASCVLPMMPSRKQGCSVSFSHESRWTVPVWWLTARVVDLALPLPYKQRNKPAVRHAGDPPATSEIFVVRRSSFCAGQSNQPASGLTHAMGSRNMPRNTPLSQPPRCMPEIEFKCRSVLTSSAI